MISLVKLMESESNVDKFTFKQHDMGGVPISYQNIKLIKQGAANGYTKYNVMLSGRYSGSIYSNKSSFIANGGDSNTLFPAKRFKSLKDALDYVCGNSQPNYNANTPLDGMDTSFGVRTYN